MLTLAILVHYMHVRLLCVFKAPPICSIKKKEEKKCNIKVIEEGILTWKLNKFEAHPFPSRVWGRKKRPRRPKEKLHLGSEYLGAKARPDHFFLRAKKRFRRNRNLDVEHVFSLNEFCKNRRFSRADAFSSFSFSLVHYFFLKNEIVWRAVSFSEWRCDVTASRSWRRGRVRASDPRRLRTWFADAGSSGRSRSCWLPRAPPEPSAPPWKKVQID